MGTPVTIHGGQGSDTINFAFTVTGTNTTFYTQQFETAVNAILVTGVTTPTSPTNYPNTNLQAAGITHNTSAQTPVYVLDAPDTTTGSGIPDYAILTAGFVLDTISGADNVTLYGNDTFLAAAINSEADVTGAGGDNRIVFVTGNNIFDGSADTGGDSIVAGSGDDTVYTSFAGNSSVYSGTGSGTFILQDTTPATVSATGFNDLVYLQDGVNTVYASGMSDAVIATQQNQTIYGYTSDAGTMQAGSILGVIIQPNSDGSGVGNDLVNGAGTAQVFVYDNEGGNTIEGGAGALVFVGGFNISDSIVSGAGTTYMFGAGGDNITLSSGVGDTTGTAIYVAGGGSESVNGGTSTAQLFLFGGQPSSGTDTVNDTLIGGAGSNLLTAGAGNETLQGGTGANYFQIGESTSSNASITISDFSNGGAFGTLYLDNGFTQADAQAIYNSTNDVNGNLVVTIGTSTTVTFTGITAGSQLTGHIVVF